MLNAGDTPFIKPWKDLIMKNLVEK